MSHRAPGRRVDGITEETKARKLLSNDARTDLARVNAHLELLLEMFETENWKGFEKKKNNLNLFGMMFVYDISFCVGKKYHLCMLYSVVGTQR